MQLTPKHSAQQVDGFCGFFERLCRRFGCRGRGGESRLERWFLRLVREAGIRRPILQKTYRDGTRTVARVDAYFPGGLVVEVSGHGTHASRRQRQIDAQRHTELTLRGLRVLTFTYEDIRDRPAWVMARLRQALAMAA